MSSTRDKDIDVILCAFYDIGFCLEISGEKNDSQLLSCVMFSVWRRVLHKDVCCGGFLLTGTPRLTVKLYLGSEGSINVFWSELAIEMVEDQWARQRNIQEVVKRNLEICRLFSLGTMESRVSRSFLSCSLDLSGFCPNI